VEGRRWYLTGVAGVLVYLVGQAISGFLPEPGSEVDEVIEHLLVHRAALLTGAAFGVLAAALLLVFATRLREAMKPSPWATPTLVGWLVLLTMIVVGQAPLLAISWWGQAGTDGLDSSQDVVRMAFDLDNLSLYALSAPFAALSVLGPIVLAWRTGFLPRWLVAVGVIEIGMNAVELAGIGSTSGWNTAGYAFGIGPAVWLVWVAGASVVLHRKAAP
jgi:hypothetical protein